MGSDRNYASCDTSSELVTEHSDAMMEGKLGVAAVDRLRQRSAAEGAERRELVVQMVSPQSARLAAPASYLISFCLGIFTVISFVSRFA